MKVIRAMVEYILNGCKQVPYSKQEKTIWRHETEAKIDSFMYHGGNI